MIKEYFKLALGNLKHRGLRSWLTVLGVFIGIAAVVSLISLGAGLQVAITGQFATLDPDKLIIQNANTGFGPPGSTVVMKLDKDDLRLVEQTSGVKEAIPRLIRVVQVNYNDFNDFRFVGSIPEEQEEIDILVDSINAEMELGKFLTSSDKGKVVLGNDFLEDAKDTYGKEIRLGSRIEIQGENFEVVGFLKKANTFTLNSVILMTEGDIKRLLDIGDEIDIIVAQVENQDEIEEVAENLERRFRKDRNQKIGEEDFSIQTPLQAVQGVNTVLSVVNLIVTGIAGISLFIGGIGIANTMYTSVLERTREIGIMKSIGAKNKDILIVFLIESGLLGLVGGIVGAAIGLGLAFGVAALAGDFLGGTGLLVTVSYPLLIASVAFAFFIGMISGILPALQASKLNTVEALRS
jgi:putative ABC transport system permease protein